MSHPIDNRTRTSARTHRRVPEHAHRRHIRGPRRDPGMDVVASPCRQPPGTASTRFSTNTAATRGRAGAQRDAHRDLAAPAMPRQYEIRNVGDT